MFGTPNTVGVLGFSFLFFSVGNELMLEKLCLVEVQMILFRTSCSCEHLDERFISFQLEIKELWSFKVGVF